MKRKIIVDVISYLIILLFLYTGINKIIAFTEFRFDISQSLGWNWGQIIAVIIPTAEILISVGLLLPKTQHASLFSAFLLMAIFTLYVTYMLLLVTPHNRACTCGGILRQMSWQQHLVFNVAYTALGFMGYWLSRNRLRRIHAGSTVISLS